MKIVHIKHPAAPEELHMEPCILALGVFDGVHRGHQTLVAEARAIARDKGLICGVMTFDPNPKAFLFPERTTKKTLTPLPVKAEILRNMEIDVLIVLEFSQALSRLLPEDFVTRYLLGLNCRHAVVGFDYRYGFRGGGTAYTLADDAKGQLAVTVVEPVMCGGEKISSTAVRHLLRAGDVTSASQYLGRPYAVQGVVAEVQYRPLRKAQVRIVVSEDYLMPKAGDYLAEVALNEGAFLGRCRILPGMGQAHVLFEPLEYAMLELWRNQSAVIRWLRPVPSGLSVTVEMKELLKHNVLNFRMEDVRAKTFVD